MIKIAMQIKDGCLVPFSQEDRDALKSYHENQVVKAKVSGIRKQRSVRQLRLFFACCRAVCDNTEDPSWNNVDKVKNQVKVALEFIDLNKSIVDAKGTFHPHYRSICFDELRHIDACNFFDRAFKILAQKLGVSIDALLQNAEREEI